MSIGPAAEQVVLGAILLQPQQFDEVREWLTPDNFEGTAERQTYQAIWDLATDNRPITPQAVEQRLRLPREYADALADVSFVVSCMQRCPQADRAPVYGRMVLEMWIRREVAERAVGLRQRAAAAETPDALNRVFAEVDGVRRYVERLHRQEAVASKVKSPTPLNVAELQPLSRAATRDDYQLELRTVRALAVQPVALEVVDRWLRVGDFADETCGDLYGELQNLRAARNPIDPIILAWRAERVGLSGPAVDALLTRPAPADATDEPVDLARRVLHSSVRAAVVVTAESLEALPTRGPVQQDATALAYARLNHLWPQQRRLVRARLSAE